MTEEWVARTILAAVMVGTGVLLVWMANAAASGRLKRNQVAGIRIPSTLASDEAWLAAHVRARRPTIYAGIASLASGLFALTPVSMPVVMNGILVAAVALLVFVLYGARVGHAAARACQGSDDAK